ncbi:hypothetical protein NKDENANG_02866 [Candidatus Entotheonellaceae bacterium PAL068K]
MAHFSDPSQSYAQTAARLTVRRYFPLRVGYVWTYAERIVTAAHAVLLERLVTLTIQSRHEWEYVAHWNFQSGRTLLPNVRYRVMDGGVQQAELAGDRAYTPFAYVLKAPLVVGTTWRTVQGYPVRIVAVELSCTVPAGTFVACIETLQEAEPTPESRMQTWRRFAPDVGLVWQRRRLFQLERLARIDTMELHKLPEPLQL